MYDNIVITPGSPGATVIFTKSDESTVTKKNYGCNNLRYFFLYKSCH